MKAYVKWVICGVSGILLAVVGVLINEWIFPLFLNRQIEEKLVLTPGSESWTNFIEPPLPLSFKVYVFNVVNEDEVKRGGKPQLSQVGPYVYEMTMKKQNVSVDEEKNTVTYYQGYTLTFDSETSSPLTEDDIVHPINLISQMVCTAFSKLGPGLNSLVEVLDDVLPEILRENNEFLLHVPVRQLLFEGIKFHCNNTEAGLAVRLLCSVIRHLPAKNIVEDADGNFLISLFDFKNTTTVGPMEIDSGAKSPREVGKIKSYQGQTNLEIWSGSFCNDLTDSYDISVLPPFLTRSSTIRIFISDAGAPVQFVYDQDINFETISGYRFIPSPNFLGEVTEYPDMYCFCPGQSAGLTLSEGCLRAGALDLSPELLVPAIISLPHFYMASPVYKLGVDGLSPQADNHSSFFDVEPLTGIPLQAASRIQVNLQLMRTSAMEMFTNVTPALVPVAWFDQGVEIDQSLLQILQDNLLGLLKISKIIMWVCISVGSLITLVGAIALCITLKLRK